MNKRLNRKSLLWLQIFSGLYSLVKLSAVFAGGLMVVGITMLIEREWPEQWGTDNVTTTE